ncbi:MAG: hypothetical protein WCF23_16395 [Candidatus Nitrosopolaris sp.]
MYVSTITDTIYASRVTTNVCLGYILTNFYAIAVIVVMMLVCESLLWYSECCCSHCSAATIAAIDKAVFLWFISQRLFSTTLYLRCITTTANNREEIVDIVELGSIH